MTRQDVGGKARRRPLWAFAPAAVALAFVALSSAPRAQERPNDGFRFRSAVNLVNVTATVTDSSGRAVTGLTRDDFEVYEDGRPQAISHFSNERVPVSLGIAIDTSGSMEGEKMASARDALDRFLFDLLAPEDEVFLYRITDRPDLIERWTTDRQRISRALRRISPNGGTALYDTVAAAAPLAQTGMHRKKALVVISDGNDTNSGASVEDVRRIIRETEVIVYAVGIDGRAESTWSSAPQWPRQPPIIRLPIPGRRQPPWYPPGNPPQYPPQYPPRNPGTGRVSRGGEGLNAAALRAMTDDSGGRTEVVRGARDLEPATASIADELSQQYYIGYSADAPRDGRWHEIEVRIRNGARYHVRHRAGYVAQ